ncbi:MAG: hypothetical protein QM610_08095 [Chitinophagaceae bacterium]
MVWAVSDKEQEDESAIVVMPMNNYRNNCRKPSERISSFRFPSATCASVEVIFPPKRCFIFLVGIFFYFEFSHFAIEMNFINQNRNVFVEVQNFGFGCFFLMIFEVCFIQNQRLQNEIKQLFRSLQLFGFAFQHRFDVRVENLFL